MAVDIKQFIIQARQKGVSDEDTLNYLKSKGLINGPSSPQPSTPQPDTGFSSNVKNDVATRANAAMSAIQNPNNSDFSKGFQAGGQVLGLGTDVAGEALQHIPGVKTGLGLLSKGIAAAFPEQAKGLEAWKGILGHVFDSLSQSHPEAAGNLQALNEAIKFAGTATAGRQIIEEAPGIVKNGIKTVQDLAAENSAKKSTQTAVDALTPNLKGKELQNHYLSDFGASTKQAGFINPQKTLATTQIKEVAGNLNDVLTSKNPLTNLKNLGTELNATEAKLTPLLESDPTPIIKQDVVEQLDTLRTQIPEEFQAIKDQKSVFNRVIDYGKKIINKMAPETTGSLSDLRNARVSFDSQAKMEFPSAFKNGTIDVSTPAGRAIKLVRDTLNNELYTRTPNGSVLQSLVKREADIFKAAQLVAPKVATNEGKSILTRMIGNIKKHPIAATAATLGAGYEVGKGLTR